MFSIHVKELKGAMWANQLWGTSNLNNNKNKSKCSGLLLNFSVSVGDYYLFSHDSA